MAAGVPFLALPTDLALADWVSNSAVAKDVCYAPLPGYQRLISGVVPAAFILLAVACVVAGIVTTVRGRRRQVPLQRQAGVTTLALSVPALALSSALGFLVWVTVGFSTFCMF